MSDAPGPAGFTSASGRPDEQFDVPLPTQALPIAEPTRELPAATAAPAPAPPVAPSPYAVQPSWWPPPTGAAPASTTARADSRVDPLIGQVGAALFWVTVGWWLFFVVRLLGRIVRVGFGDTLVIRTIDMGPEETVVAAVLSVLAALLLLLGRGRAGRSPLGWASLVLAVLTLALTVWRLLP
ncbi:MAG: hypothetical protein HOP97_06390 [Terrabacter sp.]|nr:hypothetical protein [Dermatophilaceae bacterium]NUR14761.1 hypothetical protein [Dermatophilaceae bacterium]NUS41237.1 hypothetical protein [Terrabacter sp.]